MSTTGNVLFRQVGGIGHIIFDRPEARNAMTWAMYEELLSICCQAADAADLRVVVLRGAGGTFVAGTDISQFQSFATGQDGIDYEARMETYLDALSAIPVPTLAVIEGWAVGGGLNIAACCDIRIAVQGSQLGTPIARTIGNCLSINNYARLVAGFGEGRARRMLLLGEMISAEEALAAGFLTRVVPPEALEETVKALTNRLAANAPLTLRASKAALARILRQPLPEADDLISLCYGSEDFREGVRAFVNKQPPDWKGR
jgi:enoyl-CoA hydratase